MSGRSVQILGALALKLEEMAFSAGPQSKVVQLRKAFAAANMAAVVYAPRTEAAHLERDEIAFALTQVVCARLDSRCAAWDFDLEVIEENLQALLDTASPA